MKAILLSLLSLILISCASTMPGSDIKTGNEKVSATIKKDDVFSNKQVQMYQFSIKNNTNQWMEFDGAILEGGKTISVLVGDRIESWVEACTLEKKVSDYNTNLALGIVAAAGSAVAISSQHPETSTTGAVVALGSIGGLAVQDFQKSKRKADFQKAFPNKHIFQPFVLPPGKVIQRWILVENPDQDEFALIAKNKQGESLKFEIINSSKAASSTSATSQMAN